MSSPTASTGNVMLFTFSLVGVAWIGITLLITDYTPPKTENPEEKIGETACKETQLWPIPESVAWGDSIILLSSPLSLKITGRQSANDTLSQTFGWIQRFNFPYAGNCTSGPNTGSGFPEISSITVNLSGSKENEENDLYTDESYTLSINTNGISIDAVSTVGAIRALSTLSALIVKQPGHPGSWERQLIIQNVPIVVKDKPLTPYRAAHLDCARHFQTLETLRITIDAMFISKLRVLHLHLTDDQSNPLDTKTLGGDIAANTNKTSGKKMTYTKQEILDLGLYARYRGVIFSPEFDMPGHAAIFGDSHPGSVVCNGRKDTRYNTFAYAYQVPAGELEFRDPAVLKIAVEFLKEMGEWFPYTNLIHLGGDELNVNCYGNQLDKKFYSALQTWIDTTQKTVVDMGKIPVFWHDFLVRNSPGRWADNLKFKYPQAIFQAWSGSCREIVRKGFKCLASSYGYLFLDCGIGVGPESRGCGGGQPGSFEHPCGQWCSWNSAEHIYSYGFDLQDGKNVIGGCTMLWSERAETRNVPTLQWPRAAMAGEKLWSNPPGRFPYDRANWLINRMRREGIAAASLDWKPTPQNGFRIFNGNFSDWCFETEWTHQQCIKMGG